MTTSSAQRLVYLHSHPHYKSNATPVPARAAHSTTVTVYSQAGAGSLPIAHGLARHLGQSAAATEPPWRVFGRNLIEKVLEDHHLPIRMARFLTEDANSALDDTLDELFGLHPSSWMIARKSEETILKLAQAGHVILVGWGANVITRNLPNVFHVRLVGSLEKRLDRIQQREGLSPKQALEHINRLDRGRERYLKRYFSRQLAEPLLYHLTINTDRFSDEEVVGLIAGAVLNRIDVRESPKPKSMAIPLMR